MNASLGMGLQERAVDYKGFYVSSMYKNGMHTSC